jgi:hypothetical protein
MTAHWTVDDDGTLWFLFGAGEALEPWEALPGTHGAQVAQPQFDAAYDALVADVRAARLADDLAAELKAALDWMDDPDGEPNSSVLVDRWSALLGEVAALPRQEAQ